MPEETKPNDQKPTRSDQKPEGVTPEIQTWIDTVIQKRLGREREAHRTELTTRDTEMATLKQQVADLTTKLTPDPSKKDEKPGDDNDPVRKQHKQLLEDEARKATAAEKKAADAQKEKDVLQKQLAQRDKLEAIRRAMKDVGFHNEDEVVKLTEDLIEPTADGKGYVVRENGVVKENAALDPMPLDEFYREWAKPRPWFVNSDLVNGTGARPGSEKNGGLVTKKSDLKDRKAKSEYIDKNGMESFLGLPD
jgi:hypothetical protein